MCQVTVAQARTRTGWQWSAAAESDYPTARSSPTRPLIPYIMIPSSKLVTSFFTFCTKEAAPLHGPERCEVGHCPRLLFARDDFCFTEVRNKDVFSLSNRPNSSFSY
ncbi:hypothetical protein J6590_016420 [Homalodisca vitripennis]|nr:hypothetical protein J6590_103012 [Homalodisca vitripennis]KAG8293461.1 hypothetical protein J6590_016420 [Homalodisca vitripennis]